MVSIVHESFQGESSRLSINATGMHLCFTSRFLDLYFNIQVRPAPTRISA